MPDNQKDQKDELTPVGPGADDEAAASTSQEEGRAGEDYQYAEEGGGQDEGADERVGHADDEGQEEGAQGDEEPRLSREAKRRRRKRERYERDQQELAFYRSMVANYERDQTQRLSAVEQRQAQSEVAAVDAEISRTEAQVREAETLLGQAMEAKDTTATVEALRVRDQLRDGLMQLRVAKVQAVRAAQERRNAPAQAQQPDPTIISRAQQWAREHTWFDPQGRNEDSRIAYAIEQALASEGRLDPRTDAYWNEYERRLAKRLPEHYETRGRERDEADDDDDDEGDDEDVRGAARRREPSRVNSKRKPSGPEIRVGGRERPLRKGEVYVDAARREAMEEAGVWGDPEKQARFLRAYQAYDRTNGRRRAN